MMTFVPVAVVTAGLLILLASGASAQTYPYKPIRILTSAVGGGNDLQARMIAQGVSEAVKQPVIVENRTGVLSAESVAKALPDGYTILLQGSLIWLQPLLKSNTPWDALRDFAPVTLTEKSTNVLCVHSSVAVRSVKELIALARAKPGEVSYSSGPIGGSSHLAGELFKSMTGIRLLQVPYKGGAPAAMAAAAGEVQMTFGGNDSVGQHIKSGKLIGLAVTGTDASPHFPSLPIVAATVPGYSQESWTVVLAPAKTPSDIIHRLNREIVRVLRTPEVKEKLFIAGVQVVANSPEELAAGIRSEIVRWTKVMKDAGIKPE